MINHMSMDQQIKNLVEQELPTALETAGMEWHAASVRTVGAHARAEAVELLKTALDEAKGSLDPSQFRLVEEFIFWAQAALLAATTSSEADFHYAFRKFQHAVHNWWMTLVIH